MASTVSYKMFVYSQRVLFGERRVSISIDRYYKVNQMVGNID